MRNEAKLAAAAAHVGVCPIRLKLREYLVVVSDNPTDVEEQTHKRGNA
jgi:hypothetical protein